MRRTGRYREILSNIMNFAAGIKISANFDGCLDRARRLARSFIFHNIGGSLRRNLGSNPTSRHKMRSEKEVKENKFLDG